MTISHPGEKSKLSQMSEILPECNEKESSAVEISGR